MLLDFRKAKKHFTLFGSLARYPVQEYENHARKSIRYSFNRSTQYTFQLVLTYTPNWMKIVGKLTNVCIVAHVSGKIVHGIKVALTGNNNNERLLGHCTPLHAAHFARLILRPCLQTLYYAFRTRLRIQFVKIKQIEIGPKFIGILPWMLAITPAKFRSNPSYFRY